MQKPQPQLLKALVAIASIEGLMFAGYGVAIVFSSRTDESRGIIGASSTPFALLLVYMLIAGVLFLIARGLRSGNSSARSAFVLSQGFSIVIAQTLFEGSEEWERALALGLIGAAVFSGVALISKPVREYFA